MNKQFNNKNMANSDDVKTKHQDLCRELNMDKETEEISWKSYQEVSQKFTLEGDKCHWICCALYAACRESFTPTVGSATSVVKGNCVSLTKLLRSCNISIYEFFTKITQWIEMENLSQSFLDQVNRLERSFSVTYSLYQKYHSIFEKVFIIPPNEKKTKKSRSGKCTASKLYDLCWCLFLCAKNEEPSYTVDLVTSFNLLLCCVDLVFSNAIFENRVDLINPQFPGVPENWNTKAFELPKDPICIIDSLCSMIKGSPNDAKKMKSYAWKLIMNKLFKTNTLQGDKISYIDIISDTYFETNNKSLNNVYEQYVLSVGVFDERILLTNTSNRRTNNNSGDIGSHSDPNVRALVPNTPLTRRNYLPTKGVYEPVASAAESVKKLQDISERPPTEFIKNITANTKKKIEDRLTSMSEKFCKQFSIKSESQNRFQLAKSLYYDLLEKIIKNEITLKPLLDIKVLLEHENFNTLIIACCVEIVLDAYKCDIPFPWILNCFNLQAFNFYKIIEMVVLLHEDVLTRDIIKHLNSIEEKCLDSLVWRSSSPLWDALKQKDAPLPSWADVDVKKSSTIMKRDSFSVIQSPINSAYECYNQPMTSETARRDLFNAGKASDNIVEKQNSEATKQNSDVCKRAGSLSLFFRKFYNLAWLRIEMLCKELEMDNELYLNTIWTMFEYSITTQTELMRDRNLDQLFMCAIYVFFKVKDIKNKTFADIMTLYRKQPQAESNIYRTMLITPLSIGKDGKEIPAHHGDIIYFYNNVYVQKMTSFALQFSAKKRSDDDKKSDEERKSDDEKRLRTDLLLSPHPPEKTQYPKRLILNHPVFLEPFKKNNISQSPNNITFEINKSPSKDLLKINQLVRNGKRNLPFSDVEPTLPKLQKTNAYLTRFHTIIQDRQVEDRKDKIK